MRLHWPPGKDIAMIKNLEGMQQYGKDNMDAVMKSFDVASKSTQAIAVEVADYSKKAFEDGSQALEKMLGVKSVDKAVELQQAYMKEAYEGFVAKATKVSELYADLAREAYKPYEGFFKPYESFFSQAVSKVTPK
jgi:hypothetical protein